MRQFTDGEVDAVYVVYMNFISTGVQRPDVMTLLPLSGLRESLERIVAPGRGEGSADQGRRARRPAPRRGRDGRRGAVGGR